MDIPWRFLKNWECVSRISGLSSNTRVGFSPQNTPDILEKATLRANSRGSKDISVNLINYLLITDRKGAASIGWRLRCWQHLVKIRMLQVHWALAVCDYLARDLTWFCTIKKVCRLIIKQWLRPNTRNVASAQGSKDGWSQASLVSDCLNTLSCNDRIWE